MELTTRNGSAIKPLGLAGRPEMATACVPTAFAAGIGYYFFYSLDFETMLNGLGDLCAEHRDEVVIATGSEARDLGALRTYRDDVLRKLGIDALDIFYLEYIAPHDDMEALLASDGALCELERWKDEGLIHYVGVTTHNRPLSLDLIATGRVEVLMHRYNMAHRGAEAEVLPAARAADIPVVAFTCTRWGSLLEGHRDWTADVPCAADCYRYALHHPAVRMALTAPQSVGELRENLAVLELGAEDRAERLALWEEYGRLVYGDGNDSFETQYP